MALLSDIDWAILLGVGAFLLFGRENPSVLRTIGRYYGRAVRLKQELLSEFSRAAELPGAGGPTSLRALLFEGEEPALGRTAGIPALPSVPPALELARPAPGPFDAVLAGTWTLAVPAVPPEREGVR